MLKQVHAPHLGRVVKLGGRLRPKSYRFYAPRLENYLRASLPSPPASTSYRSQSPDPALTQLYMNDQLGDCVIAARYHRIGQLTALATNGSPFIATQAQVIADYSRVGGYVDGNESTDQGCDMVTNNNDAVSNGYADGSKDLGWLALDGTNRTLVQQAVYLFEGSVDLGIELPDEWINPFPSANGFVWDVAGAPNPQNGHCVQVLDYDEKGVIIATWGLWGWITWAAMAKYLSQASYGEAYVHLSPDTLTKAQTTAPNGVAWSDMIADFDSMGGHVPPPTPPTPVPPTPPVPPDPPPPDPNPIPTPPPPPDPPPVPPAPSAGPSLSDAQDWIRVAFEYAPRVMTHHQAEKIALRALARNWPTS